MDKLIFTALGSTMANSVQRVMLTNDLANVSTTGFKRAMADRPVPGKVDGPGFPTRFQPVVSTQDDIINLRAGTPVQTGNPLDVSMNDKTVLGVQSDDGAIAFTRRGDLRIS